MWMPAVERLGQWNCLMACIARSTYAQYPQCFFALETLPAQQTRQRPRWHQGECPQSNTKFTVLQCSTRQTQHATQCSGDAPAIASRSAHLWAGSASLKWLAPGPCAMSSLASKRREHFSEATTALRKREGDPRQLSPLAFAVDSQIEY